MVNLGRLICELDRSSPIPLARQIQEQIETSILSGKLSHDHKLPSTRELSKNIGVNRATVAAAYRKLESAGLARTGIGSGTYVVQPEPDQFQKLDQSKFHPRFAPGTESLSRFQADLPDFTTASSREVCNLAALVPDERLFPVDLFRECLNHVLDAEGGRALQYNGTLGYRPLREFIAARMSHRGVEVDPDCVLIVNGAQQGCDLVYRCFLAAGDRIVVGAPTYHNIFPLLRQMDVGIVTVPIGPNGMDTADLERVAGDPAVRLIYTMPNFQNPTGVTSPLENRQRILDIARSAGLPVLEDDFECDLSTAEEKLPSLHILDQQGRVIYLGTFSKSLFPGLRIGWLAASPAIISMVSGLKKASDLENSALLQKALHEFCIRGYYAQHLTKIRRVIRQRMECAFRALELNMPSGTLWSRPRGGYGIWVSLPPGVGSERVYRGSAARGVFVSPGTLFHASGEDPGAIRLSISRTGEASIEEGVRILGEVVAAELAGSGAQRRSPADTPQHL